MITGTRRAWTTTTSRPEPALAAVDHGGDQAILPQRLEAFVGVSAVTTTETVHLEKFTSGRRTDTSSSTTSTRRAASLAVIMPIARLDAAP